MTITREQVADLQPGDIVEIREDHFPDVVTRGHLREDGGTLWLARRPVRRDDGLPSRAVDDCTLTVVSRAPRPLYVNHPRTEPVPGDVMREEDPEGATTWLMDSFNTWQSKDSTHNQGRGFEWPLRLLVDGETGQVVPPQASTDPLGHVRQGDPTPEGADFNTGCAASADYYSCTRERGHVGQHIAGTGAGNPVAAVWS